MTQHRKANWLLIAAFACAALSGWAFTTIVELDGDHAIYHSEHPWFGLLLLLSVVLFVAGAVFGLWGVVVSCTKPPADD